MERESEKIIVFLMLCRMKFKASSIALISAVKMEVLSGNLSLVV